MNLSYQLGHLLIVFELLTNITVNYTSHGLLSALEKFCYHCNGKEPLKVALPSIPSLHNTRCSKNLCVLDFVFLMRYLNLSSPNPQCEEKEHRQTWRTEAASRRKHCTQKTNFPLSMVDCSSLKQSPCFQKSNFWQIAEVIPLWFSSIRREMGIEDPLSGGWQLHKKTDGT